MVSNIIETGYLRKGKMEQPGPEEVCDFLKDYGWEYEFDRLRTIHTGWEEHGNQYGLSIAFHHAFISFEVRDLQRYLKDVPIQDVEDYQVLQRVCSDMIGPRLDFSYNSISLLYDIPRKGFCFEQFEIILGCLGHYVDILPNLITQHRQVLEEGLLGVSYSSH